MRLHACYFWRSTIYTVSRLYVRIFLILYKRLFIHFRDFGIQPYGIFFMSVSLVDCFPESTSLSYIPDSYTRYDQRNFIAFSFYVLIECIASSSEEYFHRYFSYSNIVRRYRMKRHEFNAKPSCGSKSLTTGLCENHLPKHSLMRYRYS